MNKIQTIGVIGGGQLGKMITQSAQQLGYNVVVFCPSGDSPAFLVTNRHIQAAYDDEVALKQFIDLVDIITYEFENIPYKTVKFLENYCTVAPGSEVIKICQNRFLEKSFLKENNIDTTDYYFVNNKQEFLNAISEINLPAILKTTEQGYDGKGQYIIKSKEDIEDIWASANASGNNNWLLENFIDLNYEISVIVARNISGEYVHYEPSLNVHKNNILYTSTIPADIDDNIKNKAVNYAIKIAKKLNLVGVIAVEFFVDKGGNLLVNEMAPRPHNSGHWTMDASVTSQFEQLIRAITNMNFGSTKVTSPVTMHNLIGHDVDNLSKIINNPLAKLHLYGKKEVKKGRKMGHYNLLHISI